MTSCFGVTFALFCDLTLPRAPAPAPACPFLAEVAPAVLALLVAEVVVAAPGFCLPVAFRDTSRSLELRYVPVGLWQGCKKLVREMYVRGCPQLRA